MITNSDILDLLSDAVQSGVGVRIAVSGRSMGPSYASVSDIQVVPCEASCLPLGRLVVFQRGGKWVVHRVMWRRGGEEGVVYLTKGDGLAQMDQPAVQSSEIKGMVSSLGYKDGTIVNLLSFPVRLQAKWIVSRFWLGRFMRGAIGRRES
jgi:hypothetical protein